MSAVREIELRKRKLTAAFKRAEQLNALPEPAELRADYARHLCVLVSGYVERSVAEILLEYARHTTAAPLRSYLDVSLKRLRNVDSERLLNTIGSLDAGWRSELAAFVVDERQAALNSIVGLRNDIAHGGGTSVSLAQVEKYWTSVQEVIDKVEELVLTGPRHRSVRPHRR
mgnify:CR=1 FL=1